MQLFIIFIALFIWFAFWSSQAGYSFSFFDNKFQDWQQKIPFGNRIPEAIIALSIGSIGIWGWDLILLKFGINIPALPIIIAWMSLSFISLSGKESGTWAYLNHEGYSTDSNGDGKVDNLDGRKSTLRGWNDWLAGLFDFHLGDEGYSWVWAFTKGFITTFPVGCLGAIFQPIGREIASHAKGRLPGDSNFYIEFVGDGLGYSAACFAFILIVLN